MRKELERRCSCMKKVTCQKLWTQRRSQQLPNPCPAGNSREINPGLCSYSLLVCWCPSIVKHNWKPEGNGVQVPRYIEVIFPQYRAQKTGIKIESGEQLKNNRTYDICFCESMTLLRQSPLPFTTFPLQNYRTYSSFYRCRS